MSRLGALATIALVATPSVAHADEVAIAPSRDGHLGAWLVAGPLRSTSQHTRFLPIDSRISDTPDAQLAPSLGLEVARSTRLRLVATSTAHIDLLDQLKAPQSECFALVAGVLRARTPADVLLALGLDDGVSVTLDGNNVFSRDLSRPTRGDDDLVALHLAAGDHPIVLRLHQRTGPWDLRVRLLDPTDLLPSATVSLVLPGVSPSEATSIASTMASIDIDLQSRADRYHPVLHIRFPGGAPASANLPIRISALAVRERGSSPNRLFELPLGTLPFSDRSAIDFRADLPDLLASELADLDKDGFIEFQVDIAGKLFRVVRWIRSPIRHAIEHIDKALERLGSQTELRLVDSDVTRSTMLLQRDRLSAFIGTGDKDVQATEQEAAEAIRFADQLIAGQDPIAGARGAVRLAYLSPLDSHLHPFGLYVPSTLGTKEKRWPLVVVLHGLNGRPMQMIRWFFGNDDPGRNGEWEDRHVGPLPDLDAFVVAPSGFGNLGYRDAAEVDVMSVLDWAERTFPIDRTRVYVTGPSMGGIGSASVALRFPDRFAAAAPLCGYHSYFLRGDISGRRLRPWERALAESLSNVSWADNGLRTPMYIVHGTRDLPEENSGVLIDRYKKLGYTIEDEHPDEGHQVWQKTYENFNAFHWLMRHKRTSDPVRVLHKTSSLRYADHAWVHITELSNHLTWATIDARSRSRNQIEARTTGVEAFRLDRPRQLDSQSLITVKADGIPLQFEPAEALQMYRSAGNWTKGAPPLPDGLSKRRGLSGPIQDAFLEPLVFVYGTQLPGLIRANLEVCRAFAEPRFGVEGRWPVVADVDLDGATAASHSLFLVGGPRSNAYVASIDARLPFHIDGEAIVMGSRRFVGKNLGAMFIYPNPEHPERYVVVLEAPELGGTLRALSLPRLLPDFVVYDDRVSPARGQTVLGNAVLLAGGFFDRKWQFPERVDDQ